MIIKVCGSREPENIRDVASLEIDLMGFDFCFNSVRFVKMISSRAGIIPDYSVERFETASGKVADNSLVSKPQRVGVFEDDMPQNIITRVYNYQLDYVQLNGSELPVMIENLRRTIDPDIRRNIKIIKKLNICTKQDIEQCQPYIGVADMFLFSVKKGSAEVTSCQSSWEVLDAYNGDVPFLLGGDIQMGDAPLLAAYSHPSFTGIDLDVQFEVSPAVKDVDALKAFIEKLKNNQ